MIPDIQVQLKCVIKSLKDNVLPAVDPANELAQQQIQLSLATLDMALNNLTVIHGVLRKDIQQHKEMAEDLLGAISNQDIQAQLHSLIHNADAALQDPSKGFVQLQIDARILRDGIGTAITHSQDEAAKVEKVVLAHSDASLNLGRALNKPTGFEPAPELIPSVESLLAS